MLLGKCREWIFVSLARMGIISNQGTLDLGIRCSTITSFVWDKSDTNGVYLDFGKITAQIPYGLLRFGYMSRRKTFVAQYLTGVSEKRLIIPEGAVVAALVVCAAPEWSTKTKTSHQLEAMDQCGFGKVFEWSPFTRAITRD